MSMNPCLVPLLVADVVAMPAVGLVFAEQASASLVATVTATRHRIFANRGQKHTE